MLSKKYEYNSKPSLQLNSIQLEAKKRVENKISTQVYSFKSICCPVCELSDYELLSQRDRYGLPVNTVICKKCGLLITNPSMAQDSLNKFYADDYRELYVGSKIAQQSFFDNQYNSGKKIINFLKKHVNFVIKNKIVLEVGCGAGGILSAFKDEGAEILGIDLGNDYLEFGIKNYKLNLKNISLSDYIENANNNIDDGCVGVEREGIIIDIVIYSHVLEHILNLQNELSLIKKICHEKTLIYIEVPGLLSVHKNYGDFLLYLQNAHLYHFSLGTLLNLFQKHGFSLVYGDEHIHSLFVLNNQYQTDYKNYYNTNISYLKRLEFTNRFFPIFNKRYLLRCLTKILTKIHLYERAKKIYHENFKK